MQLCEAGSPQSDNTNVPTLKMKSTFGVMPQCATPAIHAQVISAAKPPATPATHTQVTQQWAWLSCNGVEFILANLAL